MNIEAGTRISYESAAGVQTATVRGIRMAPAANGTMQPWMLLDIDGRKNGVEIHCDHSSLKMFKVVVLPAKTLPVEIVRFAP